MSVFIFLLFAAFAIGCAIAVVVQRNPLYSAISLVGVFLSFGGIYVLLAAPFIAAVQVIVYAGAIMVLVVFVIMLLNIEEEEHRPLRLRYLVPVGGALALVLLAQSAFFIYIVGRDSPRAPQASAAVASVGLTKSIGTGLFTEYLLPFEITSVLILMAIVGAMTLARRATILPIDAEHLARRGELDTSDFSGRMRLVDVDPSAHVHPAMLENYRPRESDHLVRQPTGVTGATMKETVADSISSTRDDDQED